MLGQVSLIDKLAKLLLQRIPADAGQLNNLTHAYAAMIASVIENP